MLIRVTDLNGTRSIINTNDIHDVDEKSPSHSKITGVDHRGPWTLEVQESIDQIYLEQFGPRTEPTT